MPQVTQLISNKAGMGTHVASRGGLLEVEISI